MDLMIPAIVRDVHGVSPAATSFLVMPALVAGIHVFLASAAKEDVDGRDEPGHDGTGRSRDLFVRIVAGCPDNSRRKRRPLG
jgi:hypothetical protein